MTTKLTSLRGARGVPCNRSGFPPYRGRHSIRPSHRQQDFVRDLSRSSRLAKLEVRSTEPTGETNEEEDGLTQEEDWVVPGGMNDSMSSNTQLGQAIRSACDELEVLGGLEKDVSMQAFELLKKMGYKGEMPEEGTQGEGASDDANT